MNYKMYCTNCGKEISDGAQFCTECGAKMDAPKAELAVSEKGSDNETPKKAFCTNCGKEINDGAQFCTECGARTTSGNVKLKVVYKAPNVGIGKVKFDVNGTKVVFPLKGNSEETVLVPAGRVVIKDKSGYFCTVELDVAENSEPVIEFKRPRIGFTLGVNAEGCTIVSQKHRWYFSIMLVCGVSALVLGILSPGFALNVLVFALLLLVIVGICKRIKKMIK